MNHADEVFRRVASQRRFMKAGVGGNEILRGGVSVRKIAASAPRNSDFLSGGFVAFEQNNRSSSLSRLDRAHQPRRPSPNHHYVDNSGTVA
jgi:hypothetical protein